MTSPGPRPCLEGASLSAAFPFYLLIDAELRVVGGGQGWSKLGGIPAGPINERFELLWPQRDQITTHDIPTYRREGFHLRLRSLPLKLRGQWVVQDGGALLLCSPEIRSLSLMSVLGLSLEDLAPHDATAELVTLIHTLDVSLQDSQELADRLKRRRKRLRTSMEEARVAQEHAERAFAARHSFLATMSHELRTPINGVLGMARLLEQSELDPEQQDFLDALTRSGSQLLSLVDNILGYARIDSGKLELRPVWIDPRRLAGELVWDAADRAEAKGLSLRYSVCSDAPPKVRIDPRRVAQILERMLSNAVKFTHDGEIELRIEHRDDALRIIVRDTGIGIEPQALPTLCEPFTQADLSHTRRYGGAGLGLSIVSRIVERMGGRLEVESCLGEGSTFTITLPAPARSAFATQVQEEEEETPSNGTPGPNAPDLSSLPPGLRVLVVEDNPVNQKVAEATLRRLGAQVTVANNGLEGVRAVRAHPFDLVLMDCQMPVMDGFEATLKLREGVAPKLPVIALTASVMPEDRERAAQVGMDAFLNKPLNIQEFLRTARDLLAADYSVGAVGDPVSSPVDGSSEVSGVVSG